MGRIQIFGILLLFALITLSVTGYGQHFPSSRSEHHQLVAGTNILLIPPASFSMSPNFKGFQNVNDPTSMIMIVEIPGPYSEVSKGFSADMMEPRGMTLNHKSDVQIANLSGVLIELDQAVNGMEFSKHILVYGNEEATTLINGTFLKDSVALGAAIKESILTTFVDADMKADPRTALGYTVDETVGNMKFHAVVGNGMLFNRDLKTPTESQDMLNLITDYSFGQVKIEDEKLFALARLRSYGDELVLLSEDSLQPIEIDGLSGYELLAKNKNRGMEQAYQVILFTDDKRYYLFLGTYSKEHPEALEDIKKVVQTFKRK